MMKPTNSSPLPCAGEGQGEGAGPSQITSPSPHSSPPSRGRGRTLLGCFVLYVATLSLSAADSNEIARAAKNLGASDFKTREAATRYLSEAGKAAVPSLEKAAKDSDPEVRLRARELLPAARLGLSPDTPAEIRAALIEYPRASFEEKQAIVQRLAGLGQAAEPVLISLAQTEKDRDQRMQIFEAFVSPAFEQLQRQLQGNTLDKDSVPALLNAIKLTQAFLPEMPIFVFVAIPRLDTAGFKKEADDLFDQTYKQFEKLSAADPHDPEPLNNLAWLCATARRRLDDGLRFSEQSLKESPNSAAFLDTQAELYFQKGNTDRALDLIEKAMVADPNMDYLRQQKERFKKGDKSVPPPEQEWMR